MLAVSAVLSYALAPKPERPAPAGLDDFNVPAASSSDPIPVVFGTRSISPNVVWYGDLGTRSVKAKGK